MKILAVEDNKDILSNLHDYLTLKAEGSPRIF